jgi:hypothetical protein
MSEPDRAAGGAEGLRLRAMPTGPLPTRVRGRLPVRVTLANEGHEPRLVNRRMAPGHPQILSRELFANVVEAATGRPAPMLLVRYDRDFPSPGDYGPLPPGERLSTTFDLFDWYPVTAPGRYRATVSYQADEAAAHPPEGVARGVYVSEPFEFEVTGG